MLYGLSCHDLHFNFNFNFNFSFALQLQLANIRHFGVVMEWTNRSNRLCY